MKNLFIKNYIPIFGKRGEYREANFLGIDRYFDRRRNKMTYRIQMRSKGKNVLGGRYENPKIAIMVRDILSFILPMSGRIRPYYDMFTYQEMANKRKITNLEQFYRYLRNKHDITLFTFSKKAII